MRIRLPTFEGSRSRASRCSASGSVHDRPRQTDSATRTERPGIVQHPYTDVCAQVRAGGGGFRCLSKVRVNPDGTIQSAAAPQGFGPTDFHSAYSLPASGGNGQIVAIVDAYDYPTAESDLAVYRSQYGLPAVHDGERLLQAGRPDDGPRLPAARRPTARLGRRDRARPRHGQRRLPRLQDPARRGDRPTDQTSAPARRTAATMGASPSATATAAARTRRSELDRAVLQAPRASWSPRARATAATARRVPGDVGGRARRRRHVARARRAVRAAGARPPGTAAAADAAPTSPKPAGRRTQVHAAHGGGRLGGRPTRNTGVSVYGGGQRGVVGGTSASSPLVAAASRCSACRAQPSFAYAHVGLLRRDARAATAAAARRYECTAGAGLRRARQAGARPTARRSRAQSARSSSGSSSGRAAVAAAGQQLRLRAADPAAAAAPGRAADPAAAAAPARAADPAAAAAPARAADPAAAAAAAEAGTCSHSVCSRGGKLTETCSTCADDVCSVDPVLLPGPLGPHLRAGSPELLRPRHLPLSEPPALLPANPRV